MNLPYRALLCGSVPLLIVVCACSGSSMPDAQDATPDPPLTPPGSLHSALIGDSLCVAGIPRSGSLVPLAVERLQELGVGLVRTDLTWSLMEPSQGDFDFNPMDERVMPYWNGGIDVLGILDYGNPWATSVEGADDKVPPDDPADFAAYVIAIVGHFDGILDTYEIWNEPNAGYRFWKPELKGDPAAFGVLLKAAVTAGRATCPTCRFVFGAPFFHSQLIDGHIPFLEQTQEAHPDLASFYDVMGFHPYPFYPPTTAPEGPPPANEWSFAQMLEGVREVMETGGAADHPVWTTEVGWPIFGRVTPERQADFLVRAYMALIAMDAAPICWYNLFDGPNPGDFPPEDAFGLLTYGDPDTGVEHMPKPSFHAMAQLGNRFAKGRITRDLRAAGVVAEGVRGYQIEVGTVVWWVVWTFPEVTGTVVLPGSAVEIRDVTGELMENESADTAMMVSDRPRFFRLESLDSNP